jgi:hypothetical protein
MKISSGVEAIGLGLHLTKHGTVVFADLHIGIEDSLRRSGVLVPRQHFKELMRRMTAVLAKTKGVTRIVLNGDLKHDFALINDQEWREIKRLIDAFGEREIVIVKGNHDIMLAPIARDKHITLVNEFRVGDVLIAHGDAVPKDIKGIKTIIIGHEHPTITLREKAKAERYKCFLVTKYKSAQLVVQPSFGPLTQGMDILHAEPMSPLLDGNVRKGKVFVVDEDKDEVLDFGKVSALAR